MKILLRTAGFAALLVAAATPAVADPSATIIPLYAPGTIKPLPVPELREDLANNGLPIIRNVGVPTLEVYRPAADKANGAAVIVAPGGGFVALDYVNEGTSVAKGLAAQGVTAFVLKYRLVQTPADTAAMLADHMKEMEIVMSRARTGTPVELPPMAGEDVATLDAAQAVRLVRSRAAEWGVDAKRVGFIGFSAGAYLAADVAIGAPANRPDFVGMIYGTLRTPVPADAPPAFIATAANDEALPNDPVLLYNAWKAAGRSAELHVYERGGHGFGMKRQGASSDQWFNSFVGWMRSRGIIKAVAVKAAD